MTKTDTGQWVWVPREAVERQMDAMKAAFATAGPIAFADFYAAALAAAPPRQWTEEEVEVMCRAHDEEDAVQVGELSPWVIDGDTPLEDYAEFRSRRIAAMLAALSTLGGGR